MGVIIGYIEILVVDSFCVGSESISVRQNKKASSSGLFLISYG